MAIFVLDLIVDPLYLWCWVYKERSVTSCLDVTKKESTSGHKRSL